MKWIADVVGNLGGKVVETIDNRGKRKHEDKMKKMEIEEMRHKKQLEMVIRGQEMDNSWELEQIKNSGWKDEFVLILLSIPMVLSFIPSTVGYVEDGFAALALTPQWYQWLILAVFAAIYGIRIWRRK
ncbi:MAG: hypothetical protein CL504_06775 [Actinobacteria bacterium]|nr:hypothetical protein [Actinomycetota bacterium]|tara:strand:- start:223 stop:606 length:384 start_codon:yes stop_codon:yes gene_type:complete